MSLFHKLLFKSFIGRNPMTHDPSLLRHILAAISMGGRFLTPLNNLILRDQVRKLSYLPFIYFSVNNFKLTTKVDDSTPPDPKITYSAPFVVLRTYGGNGSIWAPFCSQSVTGSAVGLGNIFSGDLSSWSTWHGPSPAASASCDNSSLSNY